MGTVEHFADTEGALRELFRVLLPGGRAIIGVPNRWDPFLRPLLVVLLLYRHGFLGQPGECIHAAVVSANARRTTAGARKPSRSINHCWL